MIMIIIIIIIKYNNNNNNNCVNRTGKQEGEVELPESKDDKKAEYSEEIVKTLVEFGFSENAAKRATIAVKNNSVEAATNWIMEHMEDIDLNDPLPSEQSSSSPASINAEHLATLLSFGIDENHAKAGLKATGIFFFLFLILFIINIIFVKL